MTCRILGHRFRREPLGAWGQRAIYVCARCGHVRYPIPEDEREEERELDRFLDEQREDEPNG